MISMREDLPLGEYLTLKPANLKFQRSNKKPESGSYELKPGIIRIAAENQFSGKDDENPYKHLEKLKQVCRTFYQDGVLVEWVLWNLFPFTLVDKANKWYQAASVEAEGDWETLEQKFLTRFFSPLRVHKLRKEIWNFGQREDEDIDEAWDRLEEMRTQGPPLGFTPDMFMSIFYYSLKTKDFERLNTCAGGSLMSRKWSEAIKILSDVCLNSKTERDRKDSAVKKPKKELMAPTPSIFEDQPPVKKTPVPYAFEEEYETFALQEENKSTDYRSLTSAKPLTEFMSWMPVEFRDTLKCVGPLSPEDLVEEEELFPPGIPLRKISEDQSTGKMLQNFEVNEQSYPHSVTTNTTEEMFYGMSFERQTMGFNVDWSDDEWETSYQSDWSHSTCSSSLQEDSRYSATSSVVNTVASQDFTPQNQYVTKLEDEETDSTSTMLKTEYLEGQLSGEIEDHQSNKESFQDVEVQISIETPAGELFENSNPRYTNVSQNSICFDESFNLNKSNLVVKPYYDNNYVYKLDFPENKNEAISFNFDYFMPNKPELEKKFNAKYIIHTLINHNLFYFCNLIIIVVMDAYVYHKFCKSRLYS